MSSFNITEEKKQKERVFSLEKIATAIHCGNLISSIRNKYKDPLIIRHRNLLPKIKSPKKINESKDPFSLNKILFREYIKEYKKTENENEQEKGIQTKNNTSNHILPIIKNEKQNSKILNNKFSYFSNELLITSGMFKQKEYRKDPEQKVKLGSILILKHNNNLGLQNYYPKIENINKINEKYNLQLDLKHLNSNIMTLTKKKKYTKRGLMNNLFKKYATASTTGISPDLNNTNNSNNSKKKHRARKKSILSIKSRNSQNINNLDFVKRKSIITSDSENNTIDFLSEDVNTFITKLSVEKQDKKEVLDKNDNSNNKKRLKIKRLKLFENNKNIINHDQKVTIDCLFSRVKENIEQNKLVYKNIDKTTFEAQKEPSYKKVKKFESIIDKIIKTQE